MFNDNNFKKKSWACIYGWFNDESIVILNPSLFLSICCKEIFKFTKIQSFYRQLHLYGFKRLSEKNPKIVYKNKNFFKDMKFNDMLNITRENFANENFRIKLSNNCNNSKRKLKVNNIVENRLPKYIRSDDSTNVNNEVIVNSNDKHKKKNNNDICTKETKYDSVNYFEVDNKNYSYLDEFDSLIDNLYYDSSKDSYINEVNTILSFPYCKLEPIYDINELLCK